MGQPFPIYISEEKFEDQMNQLLITKDEKRYYVLTKDFNTFMYSQSKHKERKHFCMYCLQCFSSENVLMKHTKNCLMINGKQAINMPKRRKHPKINNFHKQQPVPFVIYADFEAITKKYKVVDRMMTNHTPKPIRLMKTVAMDIRSYVATTTNIANQSKHIEVKASFTNSWKRCSKRLNIVKALLRKD